MSRYHQGGRRWRELRATVLRNNPQCYLCGAPATEVDHLQPVSRGGPEFERWNLRPACLPCNRSRGNGLNGSRDKQIKTYTSRQW